MELLLLAARLLLAAVFITAGLAKLVDLRGSRQAVIDFGLPPAFARPVGLMLPIVEIAVALALIPLATAWWGAIGALGLLGLFLAGISVNLARGNAPDCHCFGQLHSAPAGWSTMARNGALAVVAGFILWQGRTSPGVSAVAWLGDLSPIAWASLVGGGVIVTVMAVQGWLLLNILQQNGRLLNRVEHLERLLDVEGETDDAESDGADWPSGLPAGTSAPAFALGGLYGETLTLDALRAPGKPVLLIFSDPNCGPCNAMLPDISRWQREHRDTVTVALISRGAVDANRSKSQEHEITHLLLQKDREVAESFQALATPTAVLVAPDGTIASPLAVGAVAIQNLLEGVAQGKSAKRPKIPLAKARSNRNRSRSQRNGSARRQGPTPLAIGQPAPDVRLPDLSGGGTDLAWFRGTPTLVLCGFCNRMLDDLKQWETQRSDGMPQLLVVSTGSVEANRAMGLRSPIVLDQEFATGRASGVTGTPSAVLVDTEGKIASDPAVGAPSALALASGKDPQARAM